jgi:phage/plasmid-like protein (TIGR03299 family)
MGVPWDTVLTTVDKAATVNEALLAADCDWECDLLPVYSDVGNPDTGAPEQTQIEGYRGVLRLDTQDFLGIVGARYADISNMLAFSLFDDIAKEGNLKFTHAGALDGGRLVSLVAQLPNPIVVDDEDKVFGHINMYTSHDGSRALGALLQGSVSGCSAATNIALFDKSDGIKVRHTGKTETKVKEAKRLLTAATAAFSGFGEAAQALSKRYIPFTEVKEILRELIPDPKPKSNGEERSNARANTKRKKIRELYEIGDGAAMETREGTAWGLLCAIYNYNSNERSARGDDEMTKQVTRVKGLWFGTSGNMNRKALGILLERTR